MKVERRPATDADIQEWYGGYHRPVHAWVFECERGRGIAGYAEEDGFNLVFSSFEGNPPPATIYRTAIKFLAELNIPLVAEAAPGGDRFLTRLGFEHYDDNIYFLRCESGNT